MLTIQTQVERAKAAILAEAPRIVETYARTVLALLVYRIQSSGLPGESYSTKDVPTFWFADKAFNAGGRAYVQNNKLGNYRGFREALGLPGGYVNLTFTGKTLRSLNVAQAGVSGYTYRAKIVAGDQESQAIVGYLLERYPTWLTPITAEAAAGRDYVRAETLRVIKRAISA